MSNEESHMPADTDGPLPRRNQARFRLILIGSLVLVLIVVGVVFAINKPSTPGKAKTPLGAVQGYMQALAHGHAADALAFIEDPPTDDPFLTDAVLEFGLAINPITDIVITMSPDDPADATSVLAEYTIGHIKVSETLDLDSRDGFWFITDGIYGPSAAIYRSPFMELPNNFSISLNGVPLEGMDLTDVYLFPGTYKYQTTHPMITISDDTFVISSGQYHVINKESKLVLTAQAQSDVAALVNANLTKCLSDKSLTTLCGIGTNVLVPKKAASRIDSSTISWSAPTLIEADQFSLGELWETHGVLTAVCSLNEPLFVSAKTTDGIQLNGASLLYSVSVNITDPDHLLFGLAFRPH